ncbi:M99 family carboxypeptidase catalytic domain-containing protein, partial [Helicobacter marmotae]
MRLLLCLLLCFIAAYPADSSLVRPFKLYKLLPEAPKSTQESPKAKKEPKKSQKAEPAPKAAPTLLLMGGIHGDEAGAYYTTDLFLRHYRITQGSVWVVPVANPHGMFANKRGIYGDMNRKFASLSPNDPDYQSIQDIKALLADPEIDISLHLHDGSGYYRPTYINSLLSPYRWGNCSVIDQHELSGAKYGSLEAFVSQMVADINRHLLAPIHKYHVHNTHTKSKNDTEQLKALTFFSLSLGKPALTNEASKELDIPTRVYYHLLSIESLLHQLNITFERDFSLEVSTIKALLSPSNFSATITPLITLPLKNLKPHLTYFPLPKMELKSIPIESQTHLLGLLHKAHNVTLQYGPTTLTTLSPEYYSFDTSLHNVQVLIDDTPHSIPMGSSLTLEESQSIAFEAPEGYRVNVIGFSLPNESNPKPNESNIKIHKRNLMPKYSIDTLYRTYRAEFYKQEDFSGMITFTFTPKSQINLSAKNSSTESPENQPLCHSKPFLEGEESLLDLLATPLLCHSEGARSATEESLLSTKDSLKESPERQLLCHSEGARSATEESLLSTKDSLKESPERQLVCHSKHCVETSPESPASLLFCHSERSEESLQESLVAKRDSSAFAKPQNDKLTAFTKNPNSNSSQKAHSNSSPLAGVQNDKLCYPQGKLFCHSEGGRSPTEESLLSTKDSLKESPANPLVCH